VQHDVHELTPRARAFRRPCRWATHRVVRSRRDVQGRTGGLEGSGTDTRAVW
jgi:hypothetical protein